jgi:hypothetical protein
MPMTFRPRHVWLPALLAVAVPTHAAVVTEFGTQGDKAYVVGSPTTELEALDVLVDKAAVVPQIGTGAGTPGAALGAFGARITEQGRIGFEGSAAGAAGTIVFGGNTATFSGSSATVIDGNTLGNDFSLGRYNMTGYNANGVDAGGLPALADGATDKGRWLEASSTFSILFGSAIQALGFFGTDFSDFGGSMSLTLRDGAGDAIATLNPPTSDGVNAGLVFFGVTSTRSFLSVDFTFSGSAFDVVGFDEFIVGDLRQVPEPGTLALAGLSLLGVVAVRARRRR